METLSWLIDITFFVFVVIALVQLSSQIKDLARALLDHIEKNH